MSRLFQNSRLLHVVVIAITLSMGVSYVVQVNAASTKGFLMRDLEESNQALKQEQDRLEAEIDRLRSLSSISERQSFLGLIKMNEATYISVEEGEAER